MTDVAVTAIKDQIESLAGEGRSIVINDNASFAFAGEYLRKIKMVQKQVNDSRMSKTRKLDALKKEIMDDYRPMETKLAEIEASVKGSLLSYQAEVDRKLRIELEEKRKKDEAEMAEKVKDAEFFGEKDIELEPSKVEDMPVNVQPVVSGISTKKVWDFEVLNEALLPREMLSRDDVKIRAGIAFGLRDVPGLRIFEKSVISARR